ncbi:hypothetical protein [Henriciella sp.]|uniref:hypothetical protein n=1 Tax=Henriciella sp. TaxID=1968823 RepID=UPI0026303363|nr:hypothetical protein [Henriciella sp.]
MSPADHTEHSSLREKLIEHLFLGEVLKELWRRGQRDVEVLQTQVDNNGYDLVIEVAGIMRHVQLKASHRTAKTREVGVQTALARKPSGCIIWIWFDPETLTFDRFLWKGASPGQSLPDLGERAVRHTRANSAGVKAERPGLRRLSRSDFRQLDDVGELVDAMFG